MTLSRIACWHPFCSRSFRSQHAMLRHWKNHHHHHHPPKHETCANPSFTSSPVRRVCSQCGDKFASADTLEQHYVEQHPVSEIFKSDDDQEGGTWQHIEERFRRAWTKPTIKLHKVHRIFRVNNPGQRMKDFEEYRKEIIKQERTNYYNQKLLMEEEEDQDNGVLIRNKVLRNGNELRYCYHGTTVKCRFGAVLNGADQRYSLCMQSNCGICRILQTGFKKSKCKVGRFQRFGRRAIYCTSISSKASAYVHCINPSPSRPRSSHKWSFSGFLSYFGIGISSSTDDVKDNYKIMMACKVLAGRPYHSTHNLQHLKRPPPGYHSVQGDPGVHLNYEELVLYDNRAILPEFIILYSSSD